jgi:hypothetical protein
VLASFYGDDTPFTATSNSLARVERSFTSLSSAIGQVENARVWGGIHFRTACVTAAHVGAAVAQYVTRTRLLPSANTTDTKTATSRPQIAGTRPPLSDRGSSAREPNSQRGSPSLILDAAVVEYRQSVELRFERTAVKLNVSLRSNVISAVIAGVIYLIIYLATGGGVAGAIIGAVILAVIVFLIAFAFSRLIAPRLR